MRGIPEWVEDADHDLRALVYDLGSPPNGLDASATIGGANNTEGAPVPPLVFNVVTFGAFLREKLPIREQVLDPILQSRGLAMLVAGRGVGKTHVGMGITYAVSSGGEFMRWRAPRARRALYVDGEMPQELLQERCLSLRASAPFQPPTEEHFRFLAMDRQPLGTSINLALQEHQIALSAHLDDAEFLVLDNLSTLVNGGRENDAESWNEMQGWLLQLRRRGITVLLVHHTGRGENARGTSKREDVLDTVIHLKRPEDYDVEQGARFEVHLTKARGVHGDAALPFESKLDVVDGRDTWTCTVLRDRELDQVEDLSREGMTVRDIATEMGLSKSKVKQITGEIARRGPAMTLRNVGLSRCPTLVGGGTVGQGHLGRRETAGTSGTNGTDCPKVLIPFDRREALSLKQAAEISGKSVETIRRWCALHDIGRRIGGQWAVSYPALLMMLDGDRVALRAYLAGERDGPTVSLYFQRVGFLYR